MNKGRPFPNSLKKGSFNCKESPVKKKWIKNFVGKEIFKVKEKKIKSLDNNIIIRFVQYKLDQEVKEYLSKDYKLRKFINNIIYTLKDEDF